MVGLGIAVGNYLAGTVSSGSGARFDLTGSQDVGVLAGEGILKSTAMAGLMFNVLASASLLPTLAMHRFLLCMANASAAAPQVLGGSSLTVQFGDVAMDSSWMACAHVEGLGGILNSGDTLTSTNSALVIFVKFVTTLVSGLGETLLYAMQLSFTAMIDYTVSLVWSVQDILYTFNFKSCKIPNYAMRYVMQCGCGDTAYRIPPRQRAHHWADGALWCSGTLSMVLTSGEVALVYNPYSLDELSAGLTGLTAYVNCLSTALDPPNDCVRPAQEDTRLPLLVNQGVEPIAVWAKCKSNYAQSAWDIGAGSLFTIPNSDNNNNDNVPNDVRQRAMAWAAALSPNLLACLQDSARLRQDYSACQRLFFSLSTTTTTSATPASYYLYVQQPPQQQSDEPPDACRVFTGLAGAAANGSALKALMGNCIMSPTSDVSACDLNPFVWSATAPQKLGVAAVHGTLPQGTRDQLAEQADALYAAQTEKLLAAYRQFSATFASDAAHLDLAVFSADGDLLHEFFDCLFLGPYNRVDLRACDAEGVLDCPFYARDERGGLSRNFTACYGDDVMHGDHRLPYTCGSEARRALIKYYYRNVSTMMSGRTLRQNMTALLLRSVQAVVANYTNPLSRGCLDASTGKCSAAACSENTNGFAPCLSTTYEIPGADVAQFLFNDVLLGELRDYFDAAHKSTLPWSVYYGEGAGGGATRWGASPDTAAAAAALSHFSPASATLSFSAQVSMMRTRMLSRRSGYSAQQASSSRRRWLACSCHARSIPHAIAPNASCMRCGRSGSCVVPQSAAPVCSHSSPRSQSAK